MARPLRIDVQDGLYHVTSRGWERRAVVRDERDRQRWLELLDRVATRSRWRVFAWALLSNHFHLYLCTPQPNLSVGMRDLNSGYASRFNRRHRRCGSLFQGRFKAVLVEDESHALELTRYVHLNPVRAGLVERPEEYGWSSYQDYLGVRKSPAWLDWETILGELAKARSRARSAYRRFVEAGLSEPPSSPLKAAVGGMFLGDAEWVEAWRRRLAEEPVREEIPAQRQLAWRPTLEDVAGAVCKAFGVEMADLSASRRHGNDARSAAIYLSRLVTDEPAGVVAHHFGGVSRAAISKTVARTEKRREEDPDWDRRLAKLSKQFTQSGRNSKLRKS
ncbi:MAG: transposase [Planctomycetes bacterium]|nr:transposase [Planctomycetota bacterium]